MMYTFSRKTLILHAKTHIFAPVRVAQIMTNFWRKTLILHAKTLKCASAGVAQIMINFWRKQQILQAKTLKIAPTSVVQIMTMTPEIRQKKGPNWRAEPVLVSQKIWFFFFNKVYRWAEWLIEAEFQVSLLVKKESSKILKPNDSSSYFVVLMMV